MLRELINIIGFELDESQLRKVEGDISSAFDRLTNRGSILGNLLQSMAIPSLGIAAVKSFEEGNILMAEITQRISATGAAAGKTAEELLGMSEALAEGTDFSSEEILKAEATLLKFRNIAGDTYDRLIQGARDYAAANRMDVASAVTTLAYAMEEPTRGMTLLARQGVSFTKKEKEMIKSLQEAGRLEEAQTFVLGRLEQSYKGSAKAISDAGFGIKAFKKNLDDMLKDFGRILFPYFRKFFDILTAITKAVRNVSDSTRNFIIALSGVSSALLLLAAFGPKLIGIASALFSPWVLGIVAVGVALALLVDDFRAWVQGNDSFLGTVLGSWKTFVTKMQIFFEPFVDIVTNVWESIKGIFLSSFLFIKTLFNGNVDSAKKALLNLLGFMAGLVNNLFDLVIMSFVKFGPVILKAAYTLFYTIADVLRTLLMSAVSSVWDMITRMFGSLADKIGGILGPIFSWMKKQGFIGNFSQANNLAASTFGAAASGGAGISSLAPSPASIQNIANGGKKEINFQITQTLPPGTKADHADFIKKTTEQTFSDYMSRMLRGTLANQPETP